MPDDIRCASMADIAITGVGLATAQGSTARVQGDHVPYTPEPLPWPLRPAAAAHTYRPARDLDAAGMPRLVALAERALAECRRVPGEPIVLASCNGGATTFERDDWR